MRLCSLLAGVFLTVLWATVALSASLTEGQDGSGSSSSSGSGQALESAVRQPEKKDKKATSDIFQFSNPDHQEMLNTPTRPVKKLPDPEVDKLIDSMLLKMKRHGGGVGISANQVGHSLQISIVADPFDSKSPGNHKVYINPVITSASKEVYCFWHGCLSSLDGKFGKVATWREITVSAVDQQGKLFTENLTKTSAVIFQHEFRHLLGGDHMDHASALRNEGEMLQAMLKEMKEKKFSYLELCKDGEKALLDDYKVGETIEDYSKRISSKNKSSDQNEKQDKSISPNEKNETLKPENKKE